MRNITSVRADEIEPDRKHPGYLMFFGIFIDLVWFVGAGIPVGVIGIAMLAGGIYWEKWGQIYFRNSGGDGPRSGATAHRGNSWTPEPAGSPCNCSLTPTAVPCRVLTSWPAAALSTMCLKKPPTVARCFAVFIALVGVAGAATSEEALPRVVGEGTLQWPDGHQVVTTLFGVKVIGQLPASKKSPYLILAGRVCKECDANVSIYIHSPADGPLRPESSQPRYSYPGKVRYYMDGSPLSEARMFWGRCLPSLGPGIVWYQHDKQEDGTWKRSVYIVEVIGDSLNGRFLDRPPRVQTTLQLVRAGQCQEVPGEDMTSEP
jgi:hypothetical protein